MTYPRRALTVLVCAAVLPLVAGCGDKDEPQPAAAGSPATRAPVSDAPPTTRIEVIRKLSTDGKAGSFDPAAIYEREAAGVVTIISTGLKASEGQGQGGGDGAGQGSGFVISGSGEIATNAHVVTSGMGADITKAKEVFVKFPDDNQVPAKIVGFDPFSDVALLKVDPAGLKLRPLPLGSARSLDVGAPVAAIGSPFGEEQSLSVGVISATDRSIDSLTGFATSGAIQTDAAINSGNSGGPLLDAEGAVLGINSQIRTKSGDGSGVGFAVPVDTVVRSVDQIRRTGRVSYAYLGVSSSPLYPQLVDRFDLGSTVGAWVQQVTKDSPADDAGIRAGSRREKFQAQPWQVGGDIIIAVDGDPVRDQDDLSARLDRKLPGQKVALRVVRGKERLNVEVMLGERPLQLPRG